MKYKSAIILLLLTCFFYEGLIVGEKTSADDPLAWPEVKQEMKPWTWWWWPGNAVDTGNIKLQLEQFQQAGLGGVQIIPIYGVKGEEHNYIKFLSPEWMKMMGYTVAEAKRLGMGVDMALESGWNFGGPYSTGKFANAFVVKKIFNLSKGNEIIETLSADSIQALMAFGPDGHIINLINKLGSDGKVNWKAPEGEWHVYAISQRFSGQNVKRASPGSEGPMLNPFYAPAMQHYLERFDQAFSGYNGPKPDAVFQDSYEYKCNWSPDFFSQFEELRGYKLQDVLPALFGNDSTGKAARVKSDYRQTVSNIMTMKTNPIWIDWAHKHEFLTSYQAHGAPANWLDLYAEADVPETEMFHLDRNPLISKFASSAAHVAGRSYTGAETGTWLSEHFTVTLGELKHLTDEMFLSGINHIFYHGTCYSPVHAPWPGWLFYASTEMNPRNSIWYDVNTLNEYVSRCQSILQAGKPDNDILLYWPISDLWNNSAGMLPTMTVGDTAWFSDQPIGRSAADLRNKGYTFDYISDHQLLTAKATGGEIHVPGGIYKVIMSPQCQLIPLKTFQQLLLLAGSGAVIIFQSHLPEDVPGWGHLAERRAEFKKLLSEINLHEISKNLSEAKIGEGRILVGDAVEALKQAGVTNEQLVDEYGLFFVRRKTQDGKYYFIVNRHGKDFSGWVTIGCPAESIVIMNPLTGETGLGAVRIMHDTTQVYLQINRGSSIILKAFTNHQISGRKWKYYQVDNISTTIKGDWQIEFMRGGPVFPKSFSISNLKSWTALGDTNAQSFAGTARYDVMFDAPGLKGGKYMLNLGKVCQSARVRLNDQYLGTLITSPFSIPADLKPTENLLEIDVTNVSANRIRDLDRRHVKWKIFHNINFVNIDYKPFDASGWHLYDSGLLGPVTLSPLHILDSRELQNKN